MSVTSDLYTALSPVAADSVFDTKMPDDLAITAPVIVFQLISDTPAVPIDGAIIGREQRWQVSVYSPDITTARATGAAVITALHGLKAATIKRAEFELSLELYDSSVVPPLYHIPLDFIVEL